MPSPLTRAAHASRLRYQLLRLAARRKLGISPALRIVPYRGYGTPSRALVKARVLEDRHALDLPERRGLMDILAASYKRFATSPVPFAKVRVQWGDSVWSAVTDEEGFFDCWVEPPKDAGTGWCPVQMSLEGGVSVTAPVYVAGSEADLGVISDIDDTVIVTGVTNPLKRAYALFLSDARVRLPFEGVNGLYSALRDGRSGRAHNPIFYVSSSPWNLFEHLEEFFQVHDVPRGALLLRDWGLSKHGFAPGGGHGHKLGHIRQVMETFPALPFILIGDSGQQDATHYLTTVREFPGRVLAVYIRNVSKSSERLEKLEAIAQQMDALGVTMRIVDDSVSAARHAAQQGWIRWSDVEEVREKKIEDLQATSVVDLFKDGN